MAVALLMAGAKVGAPLVGKLLSGGARKLQDVDKAAIDAMSAARDWRALYNVMYDHQSGNPSPAAMMWREKAREYASQKFRALQEAGVEIDQSQLYVREVQRLRDGDPVTDASGRVRVVSRAPGPDFRAPLPEGPVSTADRIVESIEAASARGDAAARAELMTRLSLGTGREAAEATAQEQQASILGPLALGGGSMGTIVIVLVLIGIVLAFTARKS